MNHDSTSKIHKRTKSEPKENRNNKKIKKGKIQRSITDQIQELTFWKKKI